MKPRDYCCCAIPTITTGIYTVLVEQFVLGIVVATLAVAAPASASSATKLNSLRLTRLQLSARIPSLHGY